MTLIQGLQLLSGFAWLTAVVFYAGSVARLYRGKAHWSDVFRGLFVFVGLTQVGFVVRWLVFPHAVGTMGGTEKAVWSILYIMSAIEAAALVVASFFFERLRGPR